MIINARNPNPTHCPGDQWVGIFLFRDTLEFRVLL